MTITAKFIKARFASTCPQCKARLAVGTEIGCTGHDRVWRCVPCTNMFSEIGAHARGPFIDAAAKEAWDTRVLEIQVRYGRKHTFAPLEVK